MLLCSRSLTMLQNYYQFNAILLCCLLPKGEKKISLKEVKEEANKLKALHKFKKPL